MTETLKGRRAWTEIQEPLDNHRCQEGLLYIINLSISVEGEKQDISRQNQNQTISFHKPSHTNNTRRKTPMQEG